MSFFRNIDFYLFDLDGTLVDSGDWHDRAYRSVLERERPDLAARFDYRAVAGLSTAVALIAIGLAQDDAARCAPLKQAHYRAALDDGGLSAMPGAASLLQAIKNRRQAVAIEDAPALIEALT